MKPVFLLTGQPGTGKTSLIKQALAGLEGRAGGSSPVSGSVIKPERMYRMMIVDVRTERRKQTKARDNAYIMALHLYSAALSLARLPALAADILETIPCVCLYMTIGSQAGMSIKLCRPVLVTSKLDRDVGGVQQFLKARLILGVG